MFWKLVVRSWDAFFPLALQSTDTHVSGIVKDVIKKRYCQAKQIDFVTPKKQLYSQKPKEKFLKNILS